MHTSTVYVPHLLKQPTFSVFDADCGEILKSTAASRKKAMRPSISVLEPGLDRGVPWGCDLYTFVTSAAGHMMRTLQKPRKNRPSKRQVNHRRFLHNMIQRKFADIEAANHRLASSLYFKEEEKNTSSLLSNKRDTSGNPPQSDSNPELKKHNVRADSMDVSKTDSNVSTNADETDVGAKKQSDFGHRWKCQHKSSSSSGGNNPSKGRQKKERPHKQDEFSLVNSPEYKNSFPEAELLYSEYFQHESQFKPINVCSDDTQAPSNSSSSLFGCNENNSPSFNAALSPLSLDLWDFSGQMVSDLSACSEAQKTLNQGQLTDLYGLGNLHSKGWKDVEDYFESICSCQDGAMLEACADEEITFADLSESFTGTEDFHSEGREYKCSYSCPEDQRPTVNYFQDHQRSSRMLRQNKCTDEGQFNIFKPSQSTDTNLNLLSTSISCNVTQLQTHQRLQESSCINRNFTPFEGVAQSFSAPPHHHVCQPTPTPPLEEDWLFTDILKDKQFLNY